MHMYNKSFYFNTIYHYEVDSVFLTCQTKEKQLTNVNITLQRNVYVYIASAY